METLLSRYLTQLTRCFCSVGFLLGFSMGSAQVPESSNYVEVHWENPKQLKSSDPHTSSALLHGKTLPNVTITLLTEQIQLFKDRFQPDPIPFKNAQIEKLPLTTGEDGLFSFEIRVPNGLYVIPITFDPENGTLSNGTTQFIYLQMGEGQPQILHNLEDFSDILFPRWTHSLSGGIGLNLLVYTKKAPAVPVDVKFQSFKVPSLHLEYLRQISQNWNLTTSLQYSPGDTSSGNRVSLDQGSYDWTIADLSTSYRRASWYLMLKKEKIEWRALGGIQFAFVPFLHTTQAGSTTQTIDTNLITFLSGGGGIDYYPSASWKYSAYSRLQYPVSAGNLFQISTPFSFDGSLEVTYFRDSSDFAYGLKWHGQWTQMNATEFDLWTSRSVISNIGLLYSAFLFRVYYKLN